MANRTYIPYVQFQLPPILADSPEDAKSQIDGFCKHPPLNRYRVTDIHFEQGQPHELSKAEQLPPLPFPAL